MLKITPPYAKTVDLELFCNLHIEILSKKMGRLTKGWYLM